MFTPMLSSRSLPVNTPTTPGAALAAAVSMAVIRAWANGLRTIARCSMPGSVMLSVQRVRPVISRRSSLRLRAAPISVVGRSSTAVIDATLPTTVVTGESSSTAPPPSAMVLAQAATALTMLW